MYYYKDVYKSYTQAHIGPISRDLAFFVFLFSHIAISSLL